MVEEGLVKADSGLDEIPEGGALIEACAVLADTEAIGGPEEKIERLGLLKSEECWVAGATIPRSSSEVGRVASREVDWGEKSVLELVASARPGGGGFRDTEADGKAHVGRWTVR